MTRSNEIQNESDDHDSVPYRPQCQTIDCTSVLLLVSDSSRILPARNFSGSPESVVVRKTFSEGSDELSEGTY